MLNVPYPTPCTILWERGSNNNKQALHFYLSAELESSLLAYPSLYTVQRYEVSSCTISSMDLYSVLRDCLFWNDCAIHANSLVSSVLRSSPPSRRTHCGVIIFFFFSFFFLFFGEVHALWPSKWQLTYANGWLFFRAASGYRTPSCSTACFSDFLWSSCWYLHSWIQHIRKYVTNSPIHFVFC